MSNNYRNPNFINLIILNEVLEIIQNLVKLRITILPQRINKILSMLLPLYTEKNQSDRVEKHS